MPKKLKPIDIKRQEWIKEFSTPPFISVFVYTDCWVETKIQSRDFSTIILPAEQKQKIIDDIDKFIKREKFYRDHNIPYRRGHFHYGPPGTGKTSLAVATASYTKRPIYFVPGDLNMKAITSIPHNAVVLFEDVDKTIMTKDTKYREVDSEPISITTAYPTVNPDEHNLWIRAIRNNEEVVDEYKNDYAGLEANFDTAATGGVTLMDSVVEGILTDMKAGYAEPRAAKIKKVEGQSFDGIETHPAETAEEYKKRRNMYKNIIREVNRLRQEHYDTTRFDQEKIGILLQIIDGALTPYGSIFIMTTNFKNNIHSTMMRAGRMDLINEISYMSGDTIDTMLDKFNISADKRPAIIAKVRVAGRANNITAADLQGAIIELGEPAIGGVKLIY